MGISEISQGNIYDYENLKPSLISRKSEMKDITKQKAKKHWQYLKLRNYLPTIKSNHPKDKLKFVNQ